MNPRASTRALPALALAALAVATLPHPAAAVCRVVEPPVDSGDPGVEFDPTTSVLYVHSPDEPVDVDCADGSAPEHAGGERWVCDDGTDADVTRGSLVSLVVQPTIVARGGTAGLVMPVPARPDVATGSPTLVQSAAALVDPLVEEPDHRLIAGSAAAPGGARDGDRHVLPGVGRRWIGGRWRTRRWRRVGGGTTLFVHELLELHLHGALTFLAGGGTVRLPRGRLVSRHRWSVDADLP